MITIPDWVITMTGMRMDCGKCNDLSKAHERLAQRAHNVIALSLHIG